MFVKCVLFVVMLGWCLTGWAGKLYKIVDEQGNVTCSQFPPQPTPNANNDVQVDEMKVSGESASVVRTVGKKQYCGTIPLPKLDPTDPHSYLELEDHRDTWQRALEGDTDLNDVRMRLYLNRLNVSRDPSEAGQEKRDLQCAIQWVDKQKQGVEKARATLKHESNTIGEQISRLKAERDRLCGEEPYQDPNRPNTARVWERWSECYYRYSDELADLEYKASQVRVD